MHNKKEIKEINEQAKDILNTIEKALHAFGIRYEQERKTMNMIDKRRKLDQEAKEFYVNHKKKNSCEVSGHEWVIALQANGYIHEFVQCVKCNHVWSPEGLHQGK